jgi:hypothetical protein
MGKDPAITVSRTATDRKNHNVHKHHDTVTIIFDKPFGSGDKPSKETFELSWEGKEGKKKLSKTRATVEDIDATHVAIHFEGLKPGVYKLTRDEGRGAPEVIFRSVPDELLTGLGVARPRAAPHQFFTLLASVEPAKDKDLKSTPPDFAKIHVAEPKKVK